MAFELIEEVKKHPVPAALIAGGVVFGFLLLTGAFSSSGAAATTSGGLDPATAQLYAQTEAIQAQAQGQNAAIAGQQNLAATQASYGLSLAQIQANAQTTSTNTAASVALAQISADAQTSQQSVAAQLQAEQDQIGLGAVQINAQLAGLQDTNATTVDIASLTAGEQEDIAGILGDTQVALSNNATQASIANTNAAVSIAKGAQSVQSSQGIESTIGGLATTALLGTALFSDVRMKENVRYHSTQNGVRLYSYNFKGERRRQVGVLAHEVPDYAQYDASGFLKVDYATLRRRHMI